MPSRYLKESLLASRKLNEVSATSERLYVRLLVVVDDFGRYVADPTVLASKAYPRRRGADVDAEVAGCLSELSGAGLIEVYVANGESHLEIVNFRVHNPPRSRESKFPGPEKAEQLPVLASARIREQVRSDAGIREQLQADPPYSLSSSSSLSSSLSIEEQVPVPPVGSTPSQVALIPEPPPVEKPPRARKPKEPKAKPDDPQKRPDADAWVAAYKAGVPEADRVPLTQAFWVQWSARRKEVGIEAMLRSLRGILSMPRDKYPRDGDPVLWVTKGYANGIAATSSAPIASTGQRGAFPTPGVGSVREERAYSKPVEAFRVEWSAENELARIAAMGRWSKSRTVNVPWDKEWPADVPIPEGYTINRLPKPEPVARLQDLIGAPLE